ncbi:nucleotide-diphospho-sugar transferase [Neocallimastix sp. 'constans']|jgi:glycosyltransferase involved in cell wall biosynthesis
MNHSHFFKGIFVFLIFINLILLIGSKGTSVVKKNKNIKKVKVVKVKGGKSKLESEESKIKVSIVIPVYNTADYVERCINSALNQTLKEIEVIAIDDHSTDNSVEKMKRFEGDKRLKIVTLNQNQGSGPARNIGMALAEGEFIGFFDSDDYADERFYEFLYKYSKDKDMVNGIFVDSTNYSDKYVHHRKYYAYGAPVDSIWRRSFINKNNIRFVGGHVPDEDRRFRKLFMSKHPRRIVAPDEGIYYYYKRRVGSVMNFTSDFIEEIFNKATEEVNSPKATLLPSVTSSTEMKESSNATLNLVDTSKATTSSNINYYSEEIENLSINSTKNKVSSETLTPIGMINYPSYIKNVNANITEDIERFEKSDQTKTIDDYEEKSYSKNYYIHSFIALIITLLGVTGLTTLFIMIKKRQNPKYINLTNSI